MTARRLAPLMMLPLVMAACNKRDGSSDTSQTRTEPTIRADQPMATASASVSVAPPPLPSASSDAALNLDRPSPAAECKVVFTGSPDKWSARLGSAGSQKKRDEVLAELNMPALPPTNTWGSNEKLSWSLDGVKLQKVPFVTSSADDVWVEVWYSTTADMYETHAVRSAALVRMDKSKYCVLSGPSDEQRFADHACLGGPEQWPLQFELLHLTSAERFTISVQKSSGRCDGCGRGTEVELELLDVEKTSFVSLFSKQTDSLTYSGCPKPPETWNHTDVQFTGGYPKALIVTDEVGCDDESIANQSCTESRETSRWELRDGRYSVVAKNLPQPIKPASPEDAKVVAAAKDDGSGKGYGNKCFEMIKKKDMTAAKALCDAALSRATDDEIKGAIHYNLALIAEAGSDTQTACKEIALSLKSRPNNTTVRKKRESMCP